MLRTCTSPDREKDSIAKEKAHADMKVVASIEASLEEEKKSNSTLSGELDKSRKAIEDARVNEEDLMIKLEEATVAYQNAKAEADDTSTQVVKLQALLKGKESDRVAVHCQTSNDEDCSTSGDSSVIKEAFASLFEAVGGAFKNEDDEKFTSKQITRKVKSLLRAKMQELGIEV